MALVREKKALKELGNQYYPKIEDILSQKGSGGGVEGVQRK